MKHEYKSLWGDNIIMPSFPTLGKDENTEVLIIGGGMAGILCAYYLKSKGIQFILCEAARVGSGTTYGTTAVISAQHDILYTDIVKSFGDVKAKKYLDANLSAVQKFRELSEHIDCDYEEKPSYMYSTNNRLKMQKETQIVNSLGFSTEFVTDISLPFDIAGGVKFPKQGQFHPLKFLSGICGGMKIYEHTQIYKVCDNIAYTDKYKIKAKKIIVATHFPIINTHGLYFAKLYQKRSYVIALENASNIDGTYISDEKNGMYFRNYGNLLLIGGGDHRTGKTGGNYEEIRRFAKRFYPSSNEQYAWATQDCMSLDGIPYIGTYSHNLPNVYVASGFNEWGMTSSMVAAKIIIDKIMGKTNKYEDVFCPSRNMFKMQLLANMSTTFIDFITPTTKRCPHLGCALKWNSVEHTWDCPCHGSRFDSNGKLIDNPATGDLNIGKKNNKSK